MDASLPIVLAILFAATFVRSALGFGEALIAVPLLALVMPVNVAAPLAVLVSITVAALALMQDWRSVEIRSAALLVAATVAGSPIGLLLLTRAPESFVKALLGILIVAFSAYSLASAPRPALADNRLAWVFGFIAGILGGAYGMNGPPLVIFGTLRQWSPQQFRATLQAYFLPASAVVLAGYAVSGLWTRDVTGLYLRAIPCVIVAVLLGRVVNRRLHSETFVRVVHGALILVGLVLLVQSI